MYLQNLYVDAVEKIEEKTISFSLVSYEPEPTIEEQIEVEPEPVEERIPQPVKKPELEPIVEKVKPEPLPEPIVEKVITKPLPVVQKKKIKKKKIKKKRIKKKSKKRISKHKVTKKRTLRKVKPILKKARKSQTTPAKKNAFVAKIRSKISRAKSYPRIAQRRAMQGSVKVRFTILSNGHVSNIQVSGKKVFLKSARNAVKKAFPISVKNCPLSLPTTVNFTLRYQLH
jgi:protein TonB